MKQHVRLLGMADKCQTMIDSMGQMISLWVI